MFDKQYRFRGKHAIRVDALTSVFDNNSKAKLFERNVDVYTNAPLVGFLYGRTADIDDTRNPETNQVYTQNVMGDRVIYSQEELIFNFRLIMLLDKSYEPNEDVRIRHLGTWEKILLMKLVLTVMFVEVLMSFMKSSSKAFHHQMSM